MVKRLLGSAMRTDVRIWADRAPFEKKDLLKLRGYRWSPGGEGTRKAWCRDLAESQVNAEMLYLNQEVYPKVVGVLPMEEFKLHVEFTVSFSGETC